MKYGISPEYNFERRYNLLGYCILARPELAKFLLERGANPNSCYTSADNTMLSAAARAPTTDMINALVEHGARVKSSHAFQDAAEYRRICNAERLLELGADVNQVFKRTEYSPISHTDFYPREIVLGSALHFAVKGEPVNYRVTDSPADMVRYLLERGARANIVDGDGKTALQLAKRARMGDVKKVFEEYVDR